MTVLWQHRIMVSRRWSTRWSIDEAFDPGANALNLIRLVLAAGVIALHSYPVTGNYLAPPWVNQLMVDGFVDGFFAISGFLILRSWGNRPRAWPFLRSRLARILPGFYVCLFVTAFVAAPLAASIVGDSPSALIRSGGPWEWVMSNALLRITEFGIPGSLQNVPYKYVWNGPLWTIFWEMICYTAVLALGLLTLLRRPYTLRIIFAVAWTASVGCWMFDVSSWDTVNGVRFALMFTAGALVHQYARVLPARWFLVVICLAITLGASFSSHYRVIAALPLAYALVTSGALITHHRLALRNDLSFGVYIYGFPVQQILASTGVTTVGPAVFFALSLYATLPLAAASWFFVESPILRRIRGSRATSTPTAIAGIVGAPQEDYGHTIATRWLGPADAVVPNGAPARASSAFTPAVSAWSAPVLSRNGFPFIESADTLPQTGR